MSTISRKRRHLLWIVPLVVLAVGSIGVGAVMMLPPPGDLDLSLRRSTENGLYIGSIEPVVAPAGVGPAHSWTVEVTTADGVPVDGAMIEIEAAMPQHGHGMPTAPRVTDVLGEGRYLIEDMTFSMPGRWTLTIRIDAPSGVDETTFNLTL